MSLLGIFALVQIVAVGWRFLPNLRTAVLESAERNEAAEAARADATPGRTGTQTPPPAATPDPALVARAAQLVGEADRNFRVGDFESALRLLQQAEQILPADPAIQFRIGQAYEALDDKAQAFVAYERSSKVPGLPPEVRRQAEQKMALLGQDLSAPATAPSPGRPLNSATEPSPGIASGQAVVDDVGLQPGAMLGIVDTRLKDSQQGAKTLRIALKARPGKKIEARSMNVFVYFYEKDENGDVVMTAAKPTTQWISPPIDWADGEPELLDVEYPLPDGGLPGNSTEMGSPGRTFYGYMVGVYYKNELQDARADPGSLDSQFPLPLSQ